MVDQLLNGEMSLLRSEFVRGCGSDRSSGLVVLVLMDRDDLPGGYLSTASVLLQMPHQVRLLRRAVGTVAAFEWRFTGMSAHVTNDSIAMKRVVTADPALVLNFGSVSLELRENQFIVVARGRELFSSLGEGRIEFRLDFDDFRNDTGKFTGFPARVHNV